MIYDILYVFAFLFNKDLFDGFVYLIAIEIEEYNLLAIFILASFN